MLTILFNMRANYLVVIIKNVICVSKTNKVESKQTLNRTISKGLNYLFETIVVNEDQK